MMPHRKILLANTIRADAWVRPWRRIAVGLPTWAPRMARVTNLTSNIDIELMKIAKESIGSSKLLLHRRDARATS